MVKTNKSANSLGNSKVNHPKKRTKKVLNKVYLTIGQKWLDKNKTKYTSFTKALNVLNKDLTSIWSDVQINCIENKNHTTTFDTSKYKTCFKLVVSSTQCDKLKLKRFVVVVFCAENILHNFEIKEIK